MQHLISPHHKKTKESYGHKEFHSHYYQPSISEGSESNLFFTIHNVLMLVAKGYNVPSGNDSIAENIKS